MSAVPLHPERLQRLPMSFDEYLALPEGVRAEYVEGHAVVSPTPVGPHQNAARRLANLVELATDLKVVEAVGVWTGEQRSRVPDVVATTAPVLTSWSEETPVLVAEVLSPSTRREDVFRKSDEYRSAGIAQYWIVDREHESLTVLGNAGERWDVVLELDRDTPSGEVAVVGHGTVSVDLRTLLAP